VEEEIKGRYTHSKVTLIEGSGGVFDITLNGTLLYSKKQLVGCRTSRFPSIGEIAGLIEEALAK